MNTAVSEKAAPADGPRMAYVDNIRWVVIAMVVLMHACVTYSGLGSWYYKEETVLGAGAMLAFAAYEIFSQAFFMGILFFIAATFTPDAYGRKGLVKFIVDRLMRLGVPTLVYMLVLHPLTMAILSTGRHDIFGAHGFLGWYGSYIARGVFLRESGPLWFAFALLVFSIIYGLVRWVVEKLRLPAAAMAAARAPTTGTVHRSVILLMTGIALASFFVRLVQPVGTSWMNMQLCFFPQYVALFVAGLLIGRTGLATMLPRQAGRTWLRLAFALGVPGWLLLMGLGGALSGNVAAYGGGWSWQSAAFAVWEAFFCVSFSLGLVTLFRERANARTPVTGLLANTSFGIYVFHAPVLVAVSMAIRALTLFPPAKALLVAVIAWALSLAIAWLVRRAPGAGKFFA